MRCVQMWRIGSLAGHKAALSLVASPLQVLLRGFASRARDFNRNRTNSSPRIDPQRAATATIRHPPRGQPKARTQMTTPPRAASPKASRGGGGKEWIAAANLSAITAAAAAPAHAASAVVAGSGDVMWSAARTPITATAGAKSRTGGGGGVSAVYSTNFSSLGCSDEIVRALTNVRIDAATEIQSLAIPHILSGRDTVIASQTGTGKTLTYLLPIIQLLRRDERVPTAGGGGDASGSGIRSPAKPHYPRALVLVPNRELALQVLAVAKSIGHTARFRSESFSGGERAAVQKKSLESAIELVVATPGRLLQLVRAKELFLSDCRYVVIDEADTMLIPENGFWDELLPLVEPLKSRNKQSTPTATAAAAAAGAGTVAGSGLGPAQFVLCSASLNQRISKQIAHTFPDARRIDSSFLHRTLAGLQQHFIPVGDRDKQLLLGSILRETYTPNTSGGVSGVSKPASKSGAVESTIVFCNTIPSCRSTEHYLREAGFSSVGYHGDIPPNLRAENYAKFVSGERPILVATDMASRGLDTRFVRHVILFDFPLNPIDYLHRVGRTARAGSSGKVTSLLLKGDRPLALGIQRASAESKPIEALSGDRRAYATKPREVQRTVTKRRSRADKLRGIPRAPLILKGEARSERERRALDVHRREKKKERAFKEAYTHRIATDRQYRAKKRAWKTDGGQTDKPRAEHADRQRVTAAMQSAAATATAASPIRPYGAGGGDRRARERSRRHSKRETSKL